MRALPMWAAACLLAACDPNAKLCHERMQSAQGVVNQVDSKSIPSVRQSLSAVSDAYAACEKAQLGTEQGELLKAKNQLSAQLDLLERRAHRKHAHAPSGQELAELVKQGDPSCPRGQAYKAKRSKHEVRCTGPQLFEMNAAALRAYYRDRQFKLTTRESPAEVRAERGSELYVYGFDKLSDAVPRCVTAFAPPGMSWQELTARLTGAAPEHLVLDAPVKTERGELPLHVEHPTDTPSVHLGECGQIVAPP